MVRATGGRVNTNANHYGATTGVVPPPPYPGFPQSVPSHSNAWSPLLDTSNLSPSTSERVSQTLRSRWIIALVTFAIAVGLCMSIIPITQCNDPLDPQVRERIREEWNKELLKHEKQAAEREIAKERWAWEDERHAKLLDEWKQERIRYERELRERTRQEEEQHARRLREWELERLEHERELRRRAQQEEEERLRLDLFWGHVESHGCVTYGTKEYTAVLMNLQMDWNRRVAACRATPLEIHGNSYLPKTCEDKGSSGMVGLWEVTQQEPECTPYWDSYNNKGCTSPGSRKKFITHKLENLPPNSDWQEFCATTPANFDKLQFPGAPVCINSIWGIYGQWEIDEGSC